MYKSVMVRRIVTLPRKPLKQTDSLTTLYVPIISLMGLATMIVTKKKHYSMDSIMSSMSHR